MTQEEATEHDCSVLITIKFKNKGDYENIKEK